MNNWVFYGIFFCSLLLIVSVTVEAHAFDYFGCDTSYYKNTIIKKKSTGHPYCVSLETAKKLVERGWGTQGLDFKASLTAHINALDYDPEVKGSGTAQILTLDNFYPRIDKCLIGIEYSSPQSRALYRDDCILEFHNGTTVEIKPKKTFDTSIFPIQLPNSNDDIFDAKLSWGLTTRSNGTDPSFIIYKDDRFAITFDFENHVGFHTLLDACGKRYMWDLYHDNCRLVFYDGTTFDYKDNEWVMVSELLGSNATMTYDVNNIYSHNKPYNKQTKTFEYRDNLITHIDDCTTGITGQYMETRLQHYVDDCMLRFDNGTTTNVKPEKTFDINMFQITLPNSNDYIYDARLNWDSVDHINDTDIMPHDGKSAVTFDFENHVGFHTLLDACDKRFLNGAYHKNCRLIFYDGATFDYKDNEWVMVSKLLDSEAIMTYNTSSINHDDIGLENKLTKILKYDIDLLSYMNDCTSGISAQYNTPRTYVDGCMLRFDNGTTREIKPEKTFDTSTLLIQVPSNGEGTHNAKLTKLEPIHFRDLYGVETYQYEEDSFATSFDFENHVGFHTLLNNCDFSDDLKHNYLQRFCRLVIDDGPIFVYRDRTWVIEEKDLLEREWFRSPGNKSIEEWIK